MNKFIFIVLLGIVWGFTNCNRCHDPIQCETPLQGRKYFEPFENIQYWIYYNGDSTKIDSMYISSLASANASGDEDDCKNYKHTELVISSQYLDEGLEASFGMFGSCPEGRASLTLQNRAIGSSCFVFTNNDIQSCYNTLLNEIKLFELRENSGLIFNDVMHHNQGYWFAPDIGLIQYITSNKQDTFYLHKYN